MVSAGREHDVNGLTADELERARRNLQVSLSLAVPGSPATIVDCVERMFQFRQRCPDAEFDLTPNLFTARVPGRAEPFRALSLCHLMNAIERWAAEQATGGLRAR